ncbi:MAG: hypothetical protein E7580_08120 [Ruminococcaceae bacterium]|nr:hypothetical protein [Oscillospiraceae bacterium]
MKKVLVVALSALLVLALFIPAMADEAPTYTTTVTANKVKRGETVTVSVVVDKTVTAKGFAVDYSAIAGASGKFEYVSGDFCSAIKSGSMLAVPNQMGNCQGASASMNPIEVSGEIFSFVVKAKEDAAFGTYDFNVIVKVDAVPAATAGTSVEIYHDCVPAADYTTDATDHWKACTVPGCNVAPTKTPHSYDNACDTTCNVCNEPRVITHDFSKQNKDATNHWMECSVCGTIDESTKAAHTPAADDVLVSPADCATPAIYKKVCSVCAIQIGNTFEVGTPDASLHSGGTATCKDKAVCQHCSQPYGTVDANNHVGGTKIEKNGTEHWTVCNSCSAEIANTREGHSGGTADCKNLAVCTTCGQAYGELDLTTHKGGKADCKNKAICEVCGDPYGALNPDVHTGNVNVVDAEPATCKKEGKTEEISCKDCGVVLTPSTPVEKEPHEIQTWVETKPASETEGGEKKGECIHCGDEFTVPTAKLASSIKEDNINAPEGSKVELGETKLPEDTKVAILPVKPEQLESIEESYKEEIEKIPEAAGKDVLAATAVMFESGVIYTDPASGDTIVDLENLEKLPGKVKVTLPIAADLSNYENLVAFAEGANGDLVKVQATIENGQVVFETESAFNGIILMGNAKKAPNPNVPQNGDASQVGLFAALAIISVLTLGATFISKKAKASK